jgi:hypothetical protein
MVAMTQGARDEWLTSVSSMNPAEQKVHQVVKMEAATYGNKAGPVAAVRNQKYHLGAVSGNRCCE